MYSNNLICDILRYIDLNLNRKITINELETHFFYNKYYIMKLFKKEIGLTLFEYINTLKIYNSTLDIKNTDYSFINIAINNGFSSLEYFSETFKKVTGVNPRTYKKFWKYYQNVNDDDIKKIRTSLIYLKEIIDFKNKYLKNTKPNNLPVKKLSIFK